MSVFCLDVRVYELAPDVYSTCGIQKFQVLGLLELESQVVVGCHVGPFKSSRCS